MRGARPETSVFGIYWLRKSARAMRGLLTALLGPETRAFQCSSWHTFVHPRLCFLFTVYSESLLTSLCNLSPKLAYVCHFPTRFHTFVESCPFRVSLTKIAVSTCKYPFLTAAYLGCHSPSAPPPPLSLVDPSSLTHPEDRWTPPKEGPFVSPHNPWVLRYMGSWGVFSNSL